MKPKKKPKKQTLEDLCAGQTEKYLEWVEENFPDLKKAWDGVQSATPGVVEAKIGPPYDAFPEQKSFPE